jgi:hypothetical protein
MTTKPITLNLTLKELQQIDKYVEINDDTLSVIMKITNAYPQQKSPVEEAYKRWWGDYPPTTPSVSNFDDNMWSAFQKGYTSAKEDYKVGEYQPKEKEQKWDVVRESVKWCEEHRDESVEDYLKPHTPEKTEQLLREAFQKVQQTEEWKETQRKIDEPTKPVNEVLDRLENKYANDDVVNRMLKKWEENPPDFLRFQLGKSLEALITRWWDDVYDGIHQDWDREVAIDDLIDQIQLWLPKEQDSSGTQSASVIDLVDGYNDALTKIKSKLRNKK